MTNFPSIDNESWVVTERSLVPFFPFLHQEKLILVEGGEVNKTWDGCFHLLQELAKRKIERSDTMVVIGGGVLHDLAGFAASVYKRGISFVYIPSTLLAMVDVSVGGKTAVNAPWGKNQIGQFFSPKEVIIAPKLLATLPDKEWKEGMVEAIKHALIEGGELFDLMMNQVKDFEHLKSNEILLEKFIQLNRKIKQQVVDIDFFEKKERKILNLGHTIAHALETSSHHEITHGTAVAIGLLEEEKIGVDSGKIQKSYRQEILHLLNKFQIEVPCIDEIDFDQEKFQQALLMDKKNQKGRVEMVFLSKIGGRAYL